MTRSITPTGGDGGFEPARTPTPADFFDDSPRPVSAPPAPELPEEATRIDDAGSDASPPGPWFTIAVWVGTVGVGVFSVVGLVAAMAGWFRPLPVLGSTVVLSALLLRLVLPAVARDPAPIRPHWLLTGAVLVLAMVAGLWNGAHHGEHLVAERDPGVYIATGLWLAENGSLRVTTPTGPFDGAPGVLQRGIGFSPNDAGSTDPQFAHLNAVFLGAAAWVAPHRTFLVPAALMAAALVLLYALGVRLGRPWGGAAAALALAVSYPFVFVSRDTYSEPVSLVLLLAGLWALTFVRRSGWRAGVVAGALLGATCMARIDAYVPLIALSGLIALEVVLARRQGLPTRARAWVATAVAMVVTATLGTYDVWAFSRAYFDSNLASRLPTMVSAMVAAAVLGALAGRFAWRADSQGATPRDVVRLGFAAVVLGVTALVVWAKFFRPDMAGLEAAMATEDRIVDLLPWAKTLSYLWLEWYLGPPLVAVAFAALVWMLGRGLMSEDRRWVPMAGVAAATTVLYLIDPSITPDHPWAIRRFMAVSIPLLLLAAGVAFAEAARRRPPWSAVAAVAVGLVLLATPAQVTAKLRATAPGESFAVRFVHICAIANEEPSAILVTPGRALAHTIPTALGSWCGVPTAGALGSITPGEIHDLTMRWKAEGRRLLLLSTSPEGLEGAGGRAHPIPGPVLVGPESSVTGVPRTIGPDRRIAQSADGVLPLFLVEAA